MRTRENAVVAAKVLALVGGLCVMAACGDSALLRGAGGVYQAGAATASTPGEGAIAIIVGEVLQAEANRMDAVDVAEAGRSQVNVNVNPGAYQPNATPGSSQPSVSQYNGKMSDGGHYVGEMFENHPHGFGRYTYPNGNIYVGEFRGGKRHGQGTLAIKDGAKYVGEWRDDAANGQGTLTKPDGAKYVGELRDGTFEGQGAFTWPNGEKYVGGFRDNKFEGQGTFTRPDGAKYVGEYRAGQRNGQGTETLVNGVFAGEYREHKAYKGTARLNNGVVVEGEWGGANLGVISYPDGRKYEGQWTGEPPRGDGAAPGGWVEEKPHGMGKMTYPDGKVEEGLWREGKLVTKSAGSQGQSR